MHLLEKLLRVWIMIKKYLYDMPRPSALVQFLIRFRQLVFPGSQNYWEKRYSLGGNSGQGSYGKSAEFKSEILNKFVRENCISSVTEYGCGDGNQLTYAEYPQYIGLDISKQAVEFSSELFLEDSSKNELNLLAPIIDNKTKVLMKAIDFTNTKYGRNAITIAQAGIDKSWKIRKEYSSKIDTADFNFLPTIKAI